MNIRQSKTKKLKNLTFKQKIGIHNSNVWTVSDQEFLAIQRVKQWPEGSWIDGIPQKLVKSIKSKGGIQSTEWVHGWTVSITVVVEKPCWLPTCHTHISKKFPSHDRLEMSLRYPRTFLCCGFDSKHFVAFLDTDLFKYFRKNVFHNLHVEKQFLFVVMSQISLITDFSLKFWEWRLICKYLAVLVGFVGWIRTVKFNRVQNVWPNLAYKCIPGSLTRQLCRILVC